MFTIYPPAGMPVLLRQPFFFRDSRQKEPLSPGMSFPDRRKMTEGEAVTCLLNMRTISFMLFSISIYH